MVMKRLTGFAIVIFAAACSNPKALVVTQANQAEVAEKVGASSMTAEEKALFASGVAREALAGMARALGQTAPTIYGKSVGQIIEDQRKWAAEQAEVAKKIEAEEAAARAKAAEAARLINTAARVTITNVRKRKAGFMGYTQAEIQIENVGSKEIDAIVGTMLFEDLFGKKLLEEEARVSKSIPVGKSITVTQDIFMDGGIGDIGFDKLKARWQGRAVAFKDGTTVGDAK